MKKFLVTAAFCLCCLFASQAQTWDFSKQKTDNFSTVTTVDGLTFTPALDKVISIETGKKKYQDSKETITFTQRLKLPGTGSLKKGNYISFTAPANSKITVYGISASSEETRDLAIVAGNTELGILTSDGSAIVKTTVTNTTNESTVSIFSKSKGFNIYKIEISPAK